MPVASNHRTRSQSHRSLQELGGINDLRDLAFLDQPQYYESDEDSSEVTVHTSHSGREESEPVHSMMQLGNAFQDGQQTLLQLARMYSLHIVVAASLYMFFFEVAVRLPFLLAVAFAIPSIHMLLVPEKQQTDHHKYNEDSEALYRRCSINSAVPGEPVAQYKTAGTLHPIATTFPGLAFFSPSTWFPRATDSIDFLHKRQRLYTTFRESAYQPRRTFREAFEDTLPRLLESWTMFVVRTIFYQTISQITMVITGRVYEAITGEKMDINAYIMNVLRFYWDWATGMGGLASYSVKWIISSLIVLLDRLFMSIGRQVTMAAGVVHDTRLQYEDLNTVQF
ncbi:hypothetical protein ACET3X_002952 [Alternaria dauci]|uniref:ABC transmembrane type-1 domain-containing protein n=1 Tax=Alternaria dauci TaxID=48095 RepID=A0ABR3UR03_9PLEO